MRSHVYLVILIIVMVIGGSFSTGMCAEVKTLQDFKNSSFLKKYPQKKQMDSWALRDGGYNNSFSFRLGNDPDSWFSVEVVTKSTSNPIVFHYGLMFHDESVPDYKTKFTKQIRDIVQDFISSIDSGWPIKDVIEYAQNQSAVKYSKIADAPKNMFGKYSVRAGTVGNSIIISIDKTQ